MNDFLLSLSKISMLEWMAVFFSIGYVCLIALQKRAGWIFALISSIAYGFLTFSSKIYIQSGLQLFYAFMAAYGWWLWNQNSEENTSIRTWRFAQHLLNILLCSGLAIGLGFFMLHLTGQKNAYLDAFSTVFSLSATFMAARRILENWLYWIFIDLALTYLYALQGLELAAFNYLLYTIIAIFAYFSWRKTYLI